ncbi:Mediator of RNA polymerase II transcription subuni t 25 [Apostichopus japonicus]|uniref:Mediator of RNA polymerase II transcription subunit 25 n=1 Tax=Stichopus japonicus TaxID=307972 RepID=A0A2G8JHW0_STIJA|nr:Mediator of RNA polymerase II transcription subuni t 25 [Apostichopus japonicus]
MFGSNNSICLYCRYFNGGPLVESSYSGQYGNKHFSLVVYNSVDYIPSQTVFCHPPTSSAWEVLRSMDEIRFVGGGGESKSLLSEGLASALQIFDDIEKHHRKWISCLYTYSVNVFEVYAKFDCSWSNFGACFKALRVFKSFLLGDPDY